MEIRYVHKRHFDKMSEAKRTSKKRKKKEAAEVEDAEVCVLTELCLIARYNARRMRYRKE